MAPRDRNSAPRPHARAIGLLVVRDGSQAIVAETARVKDSVGARGRERSRRVRSNREHSTRREQPQLCPSISSASTPTGGVFRFWMDFPAAALRAALKAFIAIVSCRPVTCSTRVARHTPSRTDIKSPRVTGDTPRLERDERDGGGGGPL